jgi:triosephosphate isomerase
MNGTRAEAVRWAEAAVRAAREAPHVEVALFPPFVWLEAAVRAATAAGDGIALGGQACHEDAKGAHTGGVSAAMLAEVGCSYALVGHSETRREWALTDPRVRAAATAALAAGLRVLCCVGEDASERRAGRAREIVERQVDGAVGGLPAGAAGRVDVAYEPIWAIGTGTNATPGEAAEVHGWIRERLRAAGLDRGRILYGGSVAPANIEGFLAESAVDGVLVGGQSLDPAAFGSLVRAAESRGRVPRR